MEKENTMEYYSAIKNKIMPVAAISVDLEIIVLSEQAQQRKTLSVSSVQSLSRVRLFVTPWTAARQASLSITNSWSLLKLMSIELVMPSNHLILCLPLLLNTKKYLCMYIIDGPFCFHLHAKCLDQHQLVTIYL